jgi:hypothetical protein
MMTDFREFTPTQRTITERMRARLLRVLGMLRGTDGSWSWRFFELMMNRLEMGRYRYGPLDEGRFDSVTSAIKRLQKYLPSPWARVGTWRPPVGDYVLVMSRDARVSARFISSYEGFDDDDMWTPIVIPPQHQESGNLEHLVDAANLCLVEWIKAHIGLSQHPSPHWAPSDDGEHSKALT